MSHAIISIVAQVELFELAEERLVGDFSIEEAAHGAATEFAARWVLRAQC